MGLSITTKPTEEPVSVSEIRAHLRIDDASEDALIQAYIIAARQYAEAFLSRQLVTATYQLTLDLFPSAAIVLPYAAPLQSISSVTYVDLDGASQTLASSVYTADTKAEQGRIVLAYNQSWPSTRTQLDAATINYVCGYGSPSQVPQMIRQAIRMMVGTLYENREGATAGPSIQQVPFGSLPAVDSLLWPYRLVEFP